MKNPILAGAALVSLSLFGCHNDKTTDNSSNTNTSPPAAASSPDALDQFRRMDSTIQPELEKAAGYAILPDVGKGAAGVGATYGTGDVYEGGKRIGRCILTEGTVGAQLGGERFSELIIFRDKAALDKLKSGGYSFVANASAAAAKQGSAKSTDYRDGVAVFIHVNRGLMAEAAIGGQRLRFEPNG